MEATLDNCLSWDVGCPGDRLAQNVIFPHPDASLSISHLSDHKGNIVVIA